jgi:transposase
MSLARWADQRRKYLLSLPVSLNEQIGQMDQATEKAAEENEQARLLMTHPGVGPLTVLAFVLTLGDVTRFKRGKQVSS